MKPDWPLAVMRAIRFSDPDDRALRELAANWRELIPAADAAHLTLPLALHCRHAFPPEAQEHLAGVAARNFARYDRWLAAYREIAAGFEHRGVPFVLLKGLSHWPWFAADVRHRYQSDIDLYCPPESVAAARGALENLGYEPVHNASVSPVDHLPVMIRRTGWRWRGDYFDPEQPPSVEVHFRFWDDATEGFPAPDSEHFWRRREVRNTVPALSLEDTLRYATMHLVRHLLRGDLQVRHVYEVAHFLHVSADEPFWNTWTSSLTDAIAFRLSHEWFGCRMHPGIAVVPGALAGWVDRWFRLFAFSPALAIARPNKDELWLHLSLVDDPAVRRRIILRRLLPLRRQRVMLDPHLPKQTQSAVLSIRRALFQATFLARRAGHHALTIGPLLRGALRWRMAA